MRISFRQGIVAAPPSFLTTNGATVNLTIASPTTVQVAFADGLSNYLHTERTTVASAWVGPFVSGTNYWLYWDINPVTGIRTFGHTLLDPVEAASAPLSPASDQHWFDMTANKMKVWNALAGRWVSKIRVFAGMYQNGSLFVSMSINAPSFIGTQVGSLSATAVEAGALVFDSNGKPLKRSTGAFFTTSDVVTASLASATMVKVGSIVIDAVATSNIPAYSIVQFSGFHQVELQTGLMQSDAVYGLIEANAVIGDVVNVVLDGVVTNPSWNWIAAGPGAPLYVDPTGVLTPTKPTDGVPVAAVVDVTSILIRPMLQTVTTSGGGGGGLAAPAYQDVFIPLSTSQTVVNTTIQTQAKTATTSYLQVFLNGVLQQEGATKNFTVTGLNQITFTTAVVGPSDIAVYSFA